MEIYEFKSSVASAEINLNEISRHFGLSRKYKWEEPMILDESLLTGIIPHPQNKYFYIFYFGSYVAINLTFHETKDILSYLKKIDSNLKADSMASYTEEYVLEVNEELDTDSLEEVDFEINYTSAVVKELHKYQMGMLATILAKSVALRKVETDTDLLLDELENVIDLLDEGHLKLSDKNLSKMSGKVLRFKYSTLSNIMLLEKPDVTWKNENAELFFVPLSELFELKDRYDRLRHKTEVLLDVTEVFASLTHAKRGNKLEWMVIILIFIELMLSFSDKIFK